MEAGFAGHRVQVGPAADEPHHVDPRRRQRHQPVSPSSTQRPTIAAADRDSISSVIRRPARAQNIVSMTRSGGVWPSAKDRKLAIPRSPMTRMTLMVAEHLVGSRPNLSSHPPADSTKTE